MPRLLVPVDGSENSLRAIDYVLKNLQAFKEGVELHLLNVQHQIPYGSRVISAVGHDKVAQYHHDEGIAALQGARARLDTVGVKYEFHIGVGEPGEIIARYAEEKACDEIVMGTRGMGSVSNLLLGSVATKVIHLAHVPVLLVK